jgi:hypothetical protein
MDQIEISAICVPIQSEPAAATNPAIVSISGSPAATSDPNASTRMASVTGQEISSDFIIADLLAWLKSDHMPAAPVRLTRTPLDPSLARGPFSSSAARIMSFSSRAAPAWITAVWRPGEIDTPARGGVTVLTAGSLRSLSSTARRTRANTGSETVLSGAWTTTVRL